MIMWKRRQMRFPSVLETFQPFQLGGPRIEPTFSYAKTWESRKNLSPFANISYGFRNKDINGNISVTRMYNPFNRRILFVSLQKDFAYIFNGDAWINMIQRSNIYLNEGIGQSTGWNLWTAYFFTQISIWLSGVRSVTIGRMTVLTACLAVYLIITRWSHCCLQCILWTALWAGIHAKTTIHQGTKRKSDTWIGVANCICSVAQGLPGIMKSAVDFDYLEFGLEAICKAGYDWYFLLTQ